MQNKPHDINSPSVLSRRYQCPGSAGLETALKRSGYRPPEKEYSQAGRRAHEAVELVLRGDLSEESELVTPEVKFCVEQVKDLEREVSGTVYFEHSVDLSFLGIETPGTIDYLLVKPSEKAWLIDWKFGAMKADSPRYNWQMKAYACGVRKAFDVKEVETAIVQPTLDDEEEFVRAYCFWTNELDKAEADIKEIVDSTKQSDAPLVRGDECMFCLCKDSCPAWKDSLLEIPKHLPIVAHLETISPEQRGKLIDNLKAAESWVKKILGLCEERFLEGGLEIDGYEARATERRIWNGEKNDIAAKLEEILAVTGKTGEVWERSIVSPAGFEKIAGKSMAVAAAIEPLIMRISGEKHLKATK